MFREGEVKKERCDDNVLTVDEDRGGEDRRTRGGPRTPRREVYIRRGASRRTNQKDIGLSGDVIVK